MVQQLRLFLQISQGVSKKCVVCIVIILYLITILHKSYQRKTITSITSNLVLLNHSNKIYVLIVYLFSIYVNIFFCKFDLSQTISLTLNKIKADQLSILQEGGSTRVAGANQSHGFIQAVIKCHLSKKNRYHAKVLPKECQRNALTQCYLDWNRQIDIKSSVETSTRSPDETGLVTPAGACASGISLAQLSDVIFFSFFYTSIDKYTSVHLSLCI